MENKNTWNEIAIDRYSIIIIAAAVAVAMFFVFKGKYRAIAGWLGAGSGVMLAFTATRPARIRKQEFEGQIFFKGENDCGFSPTPLREVDGVMVIKQNQIVAHGFTKDIYKAANGTDIVIDANGNVSPAGFGSRLMQKLNHAGYLPSAPDEC